MGHNIISSLVILSLVVLMISIVTQKIKQPLFIAYILAGILLGPDVLNIITNESTITHLGELGILLLMFFIGAEIDFTDFLANARKPFIIATLQVILCCVFTFIMGIGYDWSLQLSFIFAFIISQGSTAIVLQYFHKNKQINTPLGLITSGVLIVQDLYAIIILLILNFMNYKEASAFELVKAVVGFVLIMLFMLFVIRKNKFKLPFEKEIIQDKELQVFSGILICFGFAYITRWLGLSDALGAFIAGILIGQNNATKWLDASLSPLRILFLSVFFIAVGLKISLGFLWDNIGLIMMTTLFILLLNSMINSIIFRAIGFTFSDSIYAGALLSPIGEFSFIIVTLASSLGLIDAFTYQVVLSVITLTMLLTFLWLTTIQKVILKVPMSKQLV